MIAVRPPAPGDAAQMRRLLDQLGYQVTEADLQARLAAATPEDLVLVAADGESLLGVIALHRATILHIGPVARIMTLVVDATARSGGVGRKLVEAGADWARAAGCTALELTSGKQRLRAHAFYEGIGFTASGLRLHRAL
ncbi:GNAT family N-acetyltransferase [Roseomonas frigidaquae]|uniref:GNAT family N-acetyltransferase n=1 Tax=Falsiroseomonas frigidaquae TaxID=487318 RepID=A0ABX1F608_9PROT|nr:GNAT family N-acetyltransferase [Falsiroseomonas frigidaquae]NKE47799.1 GNAT family N-acetyltransferase [Falsiroseomonas frigidaquae]